MPGAFLSRFGLLMAWFGGCKLNFWPCGNPDARIVDHGKRTEERLAISTKFRTFLESARQFRISHFPNSLTDYAYFQPQPTPAALRIELVKVDPLTIRYSIFPKLPPWGVPCRPYDGSCLI